VSLKRLTIWSSDGTAELYVQVDAAGVKLAQMCDRLQAERDALLDGPLAVAIHLVLSELRAAEIKHPNWPKDQVHAAAVLAEESGKVVKAALDYHYDSGSLADLRKELAQTGAMALRMLINLPA
jgi:hypothetical protein